MFATAASALVLLVLPSLFNVGPDGPHSRSFSSHRSLCFSLCVLVVTCLCDNGVQLRVLERSCADYSCPPLCAAPGPACAAARTCCVLVVPLQQYSELLCEILSSRRLLLVMSSVSAHHS